MCSILDDAVVLDPALYNIQGIFHVKILAGIFCACIIVYLPSNIYCEIIRNIIFEELISFRATYSKITEESIKPDKIELEKD